MARNAKQGRGTARRGRLVPRAKAEFPVVGVGASAGGVDALRQLFAHVPATSGMAFVVIQHLDPERPSMLAKVLAGFTKLRVLEAARGMRLTPGCLHVIPPGSDLVTHDGILELIPRRGRRELHLPIDLFFRSLAEEAKERSIGVVLSGSGSDGTEGLRAINAAGGVTLAQRPESAQFSSMPEQAIAAGIVDYCGTPEEIAGKLAELSKPRVSRGLDDETPHATSKRHREIAAILALVRKHGGLDFGGYKPTTVQRRIARRMALRHVATLPAYAEVLRAEPDEAKALAQDMLIHVTSFFRDPDAFAALKEHVFRELVTRKNDEPIRIWVPGCSTGEEAYGVAMCLLETLEEQGSSPPIKVFASDLSERAIETARAGRYTESSLTGAPPERLRRFFERVEGGYRIGKRVRDLVVFVRHDLTRDPPFAKLDLISCRNVLIYFDADLQRRVIPMLHYCLCPHGYLFLGKSETISVFGHLFAPVDKEQRIFVKTGESSSLSYPPAASRDADVGAPLGAPIGRDRLAHHAQVQADHILLARYAPPGVIVNDRLEIIQFRGRTGAYLEPAPGQPQANVLRMAKDGLAAHLHEAIERAKAQASKVRKAGVRIQVGAETRTIDLEVIPLSAHPDSAELYYLIVFEEPVPAARRVSTRARAIEPASPSEDIAAELERLRTELVVTKDYLQAMVSEHQRGSDELAATNEELVAANEELQSANEEMQSAKEELQSTNEELGTVNDQLRSRNQELDEVANDLENVLTSVEIPVIIVDRQLRVRRFTPTVAQVARFIPEDVGRPIDDLKLKVDIDDLPARINEVIARLAPKEWQIQDLDGHWFRLQIRPYRTADNRLDGAVLSFVDVDALTRALERAEGARDYARSIVETVTSALVVLDAHLRVVSANEAFHDMFTLSPEQAQDESVFTLGGGVFEQPAVRRALEDALAEHTRFTGLELTTELPPGARRNLSLSGRRIVWGDGDPMLLLAVDDVTDLRGLEAERAQLLASERQARVEAERANRAKDLFLATLSHELRTPLSAMLMSAQLLKQLPNLDAKGQRASASIERSATAQARLIDDLLDVSRIVSGKLLLDLGPVDFASVVTEAVDVARPSAQAKALELHLSIDSDICIVYGDAARLLQVVNNLLSNAIKFTPHAGRIAVHLEQRSGRARLSIADTGIGIRPEILPQIFSRFVQADSSMTRTHGGLGLGLSIVRHIVEAHSGEVSAESLGEGRGTTLTVALPLGSRAGVDENARQAPTPRTTARDVKGVRVLLVEDDDDTREAYAALLAELGIDVRAVASGAAGLQALRDYHPQVILADIAMPGEDGYAFIRKVRRLDPERGGRVPAAALTALASDEDKRRALQAGFQLHLAKPVALSQLAAVVALLLEWKPADSAPNASLE